MSDTYQDLLAKLRLIDEITLIELLELTSEDIINMLPDVIEQHEDKLFAYVKDETCED